MRPTLPAPLDLRAPEYLALLDRWNRTHALTALPEESRMEELVLDSCALLPHLASLPAGARIADFGTGMGIPAVVIALARPDLQVLALDKVSKKLAFLRQVKLEMGLANLEPIGGRIETLAGVGAQAGTAKATGPLPLLAGWWARHGQPGAPFFAFKGPDWPQEPCPAGWSLEATPYSLPTRGDRVILRMTRP